jgi:hypothetical protein
MAKTNIITQSALNDIKLTLNDIAANLSQHINDSMSLAHGINIFPNATYSNTNGDLIGNYVVTFLVNGVIYYAPATLTALTGQPFTNGSIQVNIANPQTVGRATWITDFTPAALAAAENTRDEVLVPHTQLGHWEAHGGMTAVPRNSYDTNGHLYARNILRFSFNGQLYEIPCDTSMTGVPQPLKVTLSTTYLYWPLSLGSFSAQHPTGYPVLATASGGTGPYTFDWRYRDDANADVNGQDMNVIGSPIYYGYPTPSSPYPFVTFGINTITPFSTLNLLTIVNHLPSGTKNFYFWCIVTDAAAATVTSDIFRIQYFH